MQTRIVAEIAQGYEGDAGLARLLAHGAVCAGADAVKFQLVYADEIAVPDYEHYELFRKLEMPYEAWEAVAEIIHRAGKDFFLDVFGERSLREATALGADGVKIHTADFFNTRFVRATLETAPYVIVSLGGVSTQELEDFIALHDVAPEQRVCFMYGFQAEPTPVECNNLRRLGILRERFPGYRFGFMDHAAGDSDHAMTVGFVALGFGIECIEKHFSLDRELQLEDFVSALSPHEFSRFVEGVRNTERALGTADLKLTAVERKYRKTAMKSVVASRDIKRGSTLGEEDLSLLRAGKEGTSDSFHSVAQVLGRILARDVRRNQRITEEMLI